MITPLKLPSAAMIGRANGTADNRSADVEPVVRVFQKCLKVLAVMQIEALPGLRTARVHHDAVGVDQRRVSDEIAGIKRIRRDAANVEMLRIKQIACAEQQ